MRFMDSTVPTFNLITPQATDTVTIYIISFNPLRLYSSPLLSCMWGRILRERETVRGDLFVLIVGGDFLYELVCLLSWSFMIARIYINPLTTADFR